MWSNVLNSVFTLSNIFNIFSFQWFFFISVRMFGECISQYFLRECVTATRSRLEEEEEGGSYLPYKGEYWSNSPLPTHFRFYDTICVLEICHFFFFFFFSPREKKKGNTFFTVTNYHSPACPTCTCAPCRQCNAVSWRRFFRSDNGSLIQSTVMVLVWNTLLPT